MTGMKSLLTSSLLRIAGAGLVAVGISLTSVNTASAVLAEGADPPGYVPDIPYEKDPNSPFIPIFMNGNGSGSASNLPEPSSLALAAVFLGLQSFAVRRRRRA